MTDRERTCGTCRWWYPDANPDLYDSDAVAECRALPPRAAFGCTRVFTRWPHTQEDAFCGGWTAAALETDSPDHPLSDDYSGPREV